MWVIQNCKNMSILYLWYRKLLIHKENVTSEKEWVEECVFERKRKKKIIVGNVEIKQFVNLLCDHIILWYDYEYVPVMSVWKESEWFCHNRVTRKPVQNKYKWIKRLFCWLVKVMSWNNFILIFKFLNRRKVIY